MNKGYVSEIRAWFSGYCRSYYSSDQEFQKNIALKEKHTFQVYNNTLDICRGENLDEKRLQLAGVIALLHDIGRFEQYRQHKTFRDSISVDHAKLGAKILEECELLAPFHPDERSLIVHAVELHNVFSIPAKVTEEELLFLKIIRDADKLDIWRVFIEYFSQPEEMRASAAGLGLPDSPDCSPEILAHLGLMDTVPLSSVKNLNDFKLMQLSWVYDLNFEASFRLLIERDYIYSLASTLPEVEGVAEAVQIVRNFVDRKLLRSCGSYMARECTVPPGR